MPLGSRRREEPSHGVTRPWLPHSFHPTKLLQRHKWLCRGAISGTPRCELTKLRRPDETVCSPRNIIASSWSLDYVKTIVPGHARTEPPTCSPVICTLHNDICPR